MVLQDGTETGELLCHKAGGDGTVNDGEYSAVLWALKWTRRRGSRARVITDSLLVASQVSGEYRTQHAHLRRYRDKVRTLLEETGSTLEWQSRDDNLAGHFFDWVLEQRRRARAGRFIVKSHRD